MNQFIKGCLRAFNGALIVFNDEGDLGTTIVVKLCLSELKATFHRQAIQRTVFVVKWQGDPDDNFVTGSPVPGGVGPGSENLSNLVTGGKARRLGRQLLGQMRIW